MSSCKVLFILLVLLGGFALSQTNSKGRSFMLSFLPTSDGRARHFMVITTYAETTVYVHVVFTNNHSQYRLSKDSILQVKLPSDLSNLTNLREEKKSVFVYATQPVSVYGISHHSTSRAAYMVIPIEKWGNKYLVATYGNYGSQNKIQGEFIILAAEDNTVVDVVFNFIGLAICKQPVEKGKLLSFDLHRGDVKRIACNTDMTGSKITGNRPFGIISGNQCTKIPRDSAKYCDQITEMMIPVSMLGQEYIVAPVASDQSKLRIVFCYNDSQAIKDLTPFEVNVFPPGSKIESSNNLYKEFSLESGAIVKVKTNRPVMAILYTSLFGNAAMTVLPTVDRFDSKYNLFVNWQSLLENEEDILYEIGIHESRMYTLKGFSVSAINDSGSHNVRTKTINKTVLFSESFPSASNIIVSVGGSSSSMVFPAGMKLDFYIGIDNCTNSPCQNNGSCYTIGNNFKCFCGNQLKGEFCEEDIYNACESRPCQNGGNCTDEVLDFTCICSANYTGKLCEINSTTTARPTTLSLATTTASTTTLAKSSSVATTLLPTTKSLKKTEREQCNCTCDNVTVEVITKTKKEIEKELIVDPKTVSKSKTKLESTYDQRPSAAGIGIMGIVFLSLVFGSIALLDLLSACHYMLSKYLIWRGGGKLDQCPKSTFQLNRKTKTCELTQGKTCLRTNVPGPGGVIILPRFKVEDGLVVIDEDMNNFSWPLKNQMASWENESIISEMDTGSVSHDRVDLALNDSKDFDPDDLDKEGNSFNALLSSSQEQKVINSIDGAVNSADPSNQLNVFHTENNNGNVDLTLDYDKNIPFDCASVELNNMFLNISPKDQLSLEKSIPP